MSVAPADVPATAVIVDLRPAPNWAAGHPPGAQNFPFSRFQQSVGAFSELAGIWEELPEADPLYLICHNGVASSWLAYHMQCGGGNVRWIEGGMPAWRAARLPISTRTQ